MNIGDQIECKTSLGGISRVYVIDSYIAASEIKRLAEARRLKKKRRKTILDILSIINNENL